METEHTTPQISTSAIEGLGRQLLVLLGEDPEREGLVGTPARWASFWQEFIEYDPGKTETAFEAIETDQMVAVTGIRAWSLCEHHLLPFWCDLSIGYITRSKVLGLSKFARIAHQFAHKLQIQERLVQQIADEVSRLTDSEDVAVLAKGWHTCMIMRGIKTDGSMVTSMMRGAFMDNPEARAEFLRLIT